jgi:signal transduction histidine kinase/ActR/RegA family two-component response regulator
MKRSFGDLSISLKLKLIIMATSGIALLLACAAFVAYDQVSTRRRLASDLTSQAKMVGTSVTAAIAFNDRDSASDILSSLRVDQDIAQACIRIQSGGRFAEYSRSGEDYQQAEDKQLIETRFVNGNLIATQPVILDGEMLGTVSLVSSVEAYLAARLRKQIIAVIAVLVGSLLVAFLISARLQRVISGPILHLADTARAVSTQKDFSIRAASQSRDETGTLIDGFNEMLEQIQARDQQLQQRNNSLQSEIEKRRFIERALRESEERYRALIAESSEAIWRLELEHPLLTTLPEEEQVTHFFMHGYLAECNDVMAQIYDKACADEIVGTRLAAMMAPSEERSLEYLRAFIRSGYRSIDQELHRIDQNGNERYFLLNLSGIVENNHLVRAWGVQREITERKQAEAMQTKLEAKLRQAQKMEAIGTLAGGIAHDFNNILGAIIGYTELATLDLTKEAPSRESLAEVLKAGNRAKELVRQILSFSRQEEHERKPMQLQSVIDEALKLLRATLPSTIEIRATLDPKTSLILGDPTQIHQVMMNLGTNAWHAMSEHGGTLEVSLTSIDVDSSFAQTHADLEPGRYLRLMVSDTGCGIERAALDRIFEPFFTTKAPGAGTGLGLAVVHGVVKRHQGAISVYSEHPKGTTFNVYFPVHKVEDRQVVDEPKSIEKGNGERILFVDDEAPLAALGKSMLERLGYRVTAQTDSLQALNTFSAQSDQFDLVITDQTMPSLSGAEMAKLMLKIRPELPVILATGYSTTINPEKAKSIGIRELLLKPNTTQTLGEAIRRALGRNRKDN